MEAQMEFKLLERVRSYSLVTSLLQQAHDYYQTAHNYKVVQYVESTLEGGLGWIAPKLQPVLKGETVQTYAKTIDEFGCKHLDSIESKIKKFGETYQHSKKTLENKWTTVTSIEGLQKNYVVPMDNYLKESYIGKPLNFAVDATDKVVSRYFPDEKDEVEDKGAGPFLRATRVSRKLRNGAYARFHDLSQKSEKGSLRARTFLRSMTDGINHSAHESLGKVYASAKRAAETPLKLSSQVAEKIRAARKEAIAALNGIIPKSLSIRLSTWREDFKKELSKSTIAQAGSNALHNVGSTISSYLHLNKDVPFIHRLSALVDRWIGNAQSSKQAIAGANGTNGVNGEKKE